MSPPTADRVRHLMSLDQETGVLRWRVPRPKCSVGARAGFFERHHGYRAIKIDRVLYREHHIVWLHFYGEWPALEIDHEDGDRQNNSIDNLRLATSAQNKMNSARRRDNSSGFKGVDFHERMGKWRARIHLEGEEIVVGYYETPRDAATARDAAAIKHHGKFARLNFPQT